MTYIFRTLINPTCFVFIWSIIFKPYGACLGFRSPNLNINCFVIILILEPPSNNTSCIVFFPLYTWITAIWLSIAIVAALLKINQNVPNPFMTTCNLESFATRFGNICNYKPKFQLFWSFSQLWCNY
jgi:hypothetical protein